MWEFYPQAVTNLQDMSSNPKQKDGARKHILATYLLPGSDFVSFLKEGNCLGIGTFAAMLGRHSSVLLCGSARTTMLRGRRPPGMASACLSDNEIRCKIHR